MTPPEPGYIKTACRKCGQHIEAPDEYGGTFVPCPACGETVAIPEATDPAPLPSSPQVTQRIQMPPVPPPSRPSSRPQSVPRQFTEVPPTPVSDAYLLPALLIIVGITLGILVGLGVLQPDSPVVVLSSLLLSLLVFVLILGHLGAIAARLKTIELLLRRK